MKYALYLLLIGMPLFLNAQQGSITNISVIQRPSRKLDLSSSDANMADSPRAGGYSVRCFKD